MANGAGADSMESMTRSAECREEISQMLHTRMQAMKQWRDSVRSIVENAAQRDRLSDSIPDQKDFQENATKNLQWLVSDQKYHRLGENSQTLLENIVNILNKDRHDVNKIRLDKPLSSESQQMIQSVYDSF